MPADFTTALIVLARFMLGAHFFIAGVRNFLNFAALAPRMEARGVPQPTLSLIAGLTVQTLGGAMLAVSLWPGIGAAGLIAFTIGATALFHNFWDYAGEERVSHINFNLTNMALIGGLLLAVATA